MNGKETYSIKHYDKEKSFNEKECYISKDSDLMNISIKLKQYNLLVRDFVKFEVYGIGKNSNTIRSKLIALLRQLKFPERVIFLKIQHDFDKSKEIYHIQQIAK